MTKKKKISQVEFALIIFTIWFILSAALLAFGKLIPPGDEMAFSLLAFYFVYPVFALFSTMLLSVKNNIFGYLITLLYALGGLVLPAATFSGFDSISLFFGAFPAFVGLLLGALIHILKNKVKSK